MFLNKCPGTKGGDDDDMNPNLPSYIPPGTCNGQQDLCSLVPGICDNSDDNDRDDGTSSSSEETPEDLLKRAGRNDKPTPDPYRAQIGLNLIAYIWVYYYPRWRSYLYDATFTRSQILRRYWQFQPVSCDGNDDDPLFNIIQIPDQNWTPPPGASPEVEHVFDVSSQITLMT